jgi:hypothetical protein
VGGFRADPRMGHRPMATDLPPDAASIIAWYWMQNFAPTFETSLLPPADWLAQERAYGIRIGSLLDAHAARRRCGEAHPVYDFLFTYYSHTPALLRRWHPGLGVVLTGTEAERFLDWRGYARIGDGIGACLSQIRTARLPALRWMLSMLENTQSRPARYGCYGLHEWAMVYRASDIRHPHPLRMSPSDLAAFVESQPICCTHYDAFRFFTPEARPLNRVQPERATTADLEQRGCLHANMDLYKWAYKLVPLTSSRLIADCFELAREIREVDMRASPYDLAHLGFPAIRIEEASGRSEYEAFQRDFSLRAEPLRDELLGLLRRVVHTL